MSTETGALIVIEDLNPEVLFTPQGVKDVLDSIKKRVAEFTPDVTTASGRQDIGSLSWKVARSKTLLEGLAKDQVADWKKKVKAVDDQRKVIVSELDTLRAQVRKPLTDWEQAETERKKNIETLVLNIQVVGDKARDWMKISLATLEQLHQGLRDMAIDEATYAEYTAEAELVRGKAVQALSDAITSRKEHDERMVELERLRKEAAEAARKELERKEAEAKKTEGSRPIDWSINSDTEGIRGDLTVKLTDTVIEPPPPAAEPAAGPTYYAPLAGQKRQAAVVLRERVGYIDLRLAEEIIEAIANDEIPFVKFVV